MEMEDLYGSKDDDVDEDTRYIAQSLIASPLAEFYGLDTPTVSCIHNLQTGSEVFNENFGLQQSGEDYPDVHDDHDEEEEEDDDEEDDEDAHPFREDELDHARAPRPMSGHHAPVMTAQAPPPRMSYSPPPVTDAPGSYSVPGINAQNRYPSQYGASDERSVYSQQERSVYSSAHQVIEMTRSCVISNAIY